MVTKLAMHWVKLRVLHPDLYTKLDKAYRKKAAKKIRQRVKEWRKNNRERFNAYRREHYAKMKKETG